MSREKFGSNTVEIEGVRHLGDHESVVYVRHVDDRDDGLKVTGKSQKPVKRSSQKHVLFSGKDTATEDVTESLDLSDSEGKDNTNNNNTSHNTEAKNKLTLRKTSQDQRLETKTSKKKGTPQVTVDKLKDQKKAKDITKSLELYGLSPRIARKHKQIASHSKEGDSGHVVQKHHGRQVITTSVESLGLSPGIKRKGATNALINGSHPAPIKTILTHKLTSHSMDTINHSSNSSSSEPSPRQSPNLREVRKMSIPQVPIHLGLIGSDEELERIRFIKKALTPDPSLPDILRKLSNSTSYSLKPPVVVGGRRRSVSMDPMDSQYKQARDSLKKKVERIDSAHK